MDTEPDAGNSPDNGEPPAQTNEETNMPEQTTLVDETKSEKSTISDQNKTEKSSLVDSEKDSVSTDCCGPISIPLLCIKVFYFFFLGGLGCVLPFLSIYFKQLGLGPQQIGIISGLRPLVGFSSGPLWGAIADKFNVRRVLLLISVLAWVGVYVALAFVPPPDRIDQCPEDLTPHRNPVSIIKRQNDPHDFLIADNKTINLTKDQIEILQENLSWIYDPVGLNRVFVIVLVLILMGEFVQSPTTALSDAGTLQTLGADNLHLYGHQRAWGPLGWACGSLTVGALVAQTRTPVVICGIELNFSDYFYFVYVFVGFMFFAFIMATQIKFKDDNGKEVVEMKAPEEKIAKDESYDTFAVIKMFLNVHYGSWLVTAFFVGSFNGVIWGFLYWHLENLGGDQLTIGVANVVTCLSEFIMFFFVHHVIKIMGHMGIMYMGLLGYSIRFVVYGLLTNPWFVIPAEILQGVTFSCIWVSLTAYSTMSVPNHSLATIQGIMHGVYFGLGQGCGNLVAGSLISLWGAPITFFIMSGTSLMVLLLFFICQKCSTRPDSSYERFPETTIDETKDEK